MVKPQTLKGFRDFLPTQAKKRQYVINTIKSVFESYGFEPLETPALEYQEVLAGKYGEEGEKLMYKFTDNGGREVALRYDQTVPLSRVVAQYQNELPTPFKRYQIQNVWRAENTQKGRFREFLQCDADIVGSSSPLADAEVIAAAAQALEKLGFSKFTVLMNDRRVFTELVENGTLTNDEMLTAVRAIDKLKKIGEDGVIKEMVEKGFTEASAKKTLQMIKEKEKTDTLNDISNYLKDKDVEKSWLQFDPTLARGLDYYTGLIFEIEIEGYPVGSVCGGGRYDKLIGMFAGRDIPAVGFAFGFDRLMEAMEEFNLFPSDLGQTQALVTIFSKDLKEKSLEATMALRQNNINTELYLDENAKMEKQLKYANQKGIPFVVIIGPEEAEKQMATVKNMKTGEQRTVSFTQLPNEFR